MIGIEVMSDNEVINDNEMMNDYALLRYNNQVLSGNKDEYQR